MKVKAPKQAAAAPLPRRDDTLERVRRERELRRRRGGAADILTGVDGAEATPVGVKQILGM